jgi:hypothetical protein
MFVGCIISDVIWTVSSPVVKSALGTTVVSSFTYVACVTSPEFAVVRHAPIESAARGLRGQNLGTRVRHFRVARGGRLRLGRGRAGYEGVVVSQCTQRRGSQTRAGRSLRGTTRANGARVAQAIRGSTARSTGDYPMSAKSGTRAPPDTPREAPDRAGGRCNFQACASGGRTVGSGPRALPMQAVCATRSYAIRMASPSSRTSTRSTSTRRRSAASTAPASWSTAPLPSVTRRSIEQRHSRPARRTHLPCRTTRPTSRPTRAKTQP